MYSSCVKLFHQKCVEEQVMNRFVLVLCCVFVGGCAVGNQHQYSGIAPEVSVPSGNSIAVGVHDQRPYVVAGGKSEMFVGLSRGGFGNPFDVTTASGKPLADDFRATIADIFRRNGVNVKEITIRPASTGVQARDAVISAGQGRSLLLSLAEWKSDTYMNTALIYDVRLVVLDSAGKVLGDEALRGRDNLGGSAINPPAHAIEVVPGAYRRKLEELLNNPAIKKALQ
jgi:hypothetical protein